MLSKHSLHRPTDQIIEGPIEAGQMLGMAPEIILKKYFNKRNDLMKLLRVYYGLSLDNMAGKIGISAHELNTFENSDELIPFQLVPKIAKVLNLDLKTLLQLLGHANLNSADTNDNELKIAAQYSGPDLTKQEKIDLEELFKTIVENIKNKK